MSEEKFTKGPWFADWKNNPTFFPFVWQDNGFAIAKVCGKPSDKLENTTIPVACLSDFAEPEKVLANAALIAAAPEMYEAIRKIVRSECENCRLKQMRCDCRFQELADVLKKARGEE